MTENGARFVCTSSIADSVNAGRILRLNDTLDDYFRSVMPFYFDGFVSSRRTGVAAVFRVVVAS